MNTTEHQGFWAMVGYESKPTLAEGALLLTGSVAALGLAALARGRSLSEENQWWVIPLIQKRETPRKMTEEEMKGFNRLLYKLDLDNDDLAKKLLEIIESGSDDDLVSTLNDMADLMNTIRRFKRSRVWSDFITLASNDAKYAVRDAVRKKVLGKKVEPDIIGLKIFEVLKKAKSKGLFEKYYQARADAEKKDPMLKKFGDMDRTQEMLEDLLFLINKHDSGVEVDWSTFQDLQTLKFEGKHVPGKLESEILADVAKAVSTATKKSGAPSKEDVLAGLSEENRRQFENLKLMRRRRDLLARRDPSWAISEYPFEYKRGQRIAPHMKEVLDYIADLTRKGERIVIHGRDGELVYDLLKRYRGVDMSKVNYALTSRTLSMRPHTPSYDRYLKSVIPKGAIHVDTGFQGSIPSHLQNLGYDVRRIDLIRRESSEREDWIKEIPSGFQSWSHQQIIDQLEHVPQRLDHPMKWDAGLIMYSKDSPGYHARYYGVLDALGIPRLRTKMPLTRFEQR